VISALTQTTTFVGIKPPSGRQNRCGRDPSATTQGRGLPGDLIEFKPVGRGGTKFAPAFEWLKENEPEISGAVYVTDLDVYSGDFGDEPPFPVLWAVHGDRRELTQRMDGVPFGECIEIAE
jgi:predicted metal-dependent peptidase